MASEHVEWDANGSAVVDGIRVQVRPGSIGHSWLAAVWIVGEWWTSSPFERLGDAQKAACDIARKFARGDRHVR